VEKSIAQYDKVELVDVDLLSQQIKKTIQQRKKEIPKAEIIISEVTKDFFDWEYKRKFAPNIRYFKANLKNIEKNELHSIHKKFRYAKIEDMELSNKMVQKITNRFAKYIIDHPQDAEKISGLMEEIFVINPKK
jgi:glutamyl-tRNA reductase